MSTQETRPRWLASLGAAPILAALLGTAACAAASPTEATEWNAVFERQSGFGWSGGDAAYSVELPRERTLWLFGDTYLSDVTNGQRERVEMRFGNTIAIQSHGLAGASPSAKDVVFDWGPPGSSGWIPVDRKLLAGPAAPASGPEAIELALPVVSWPLHGVVLGSDLVLFNALVSPFDCDDCEGFAFKVHGSTATIVRGVDRPYAEWGARPGAGWAPELLPEPRLVPHSRAAEELRDATGLLFGTYVMPDPEDPRTLYIYGHREAPQVAALVVARVGGVLAADDVLDFGRWEFWDGQRWGASADESASIADGSPPEASVVRVPSPAGGSGGFALVQSDRTLRGEIHVAIAAHPWGPFVPRYQLSLDDCPVSGFDPHAEQYTYSGKAHPDLSNDAELLVSLVTVPARGERATSVIADPRHYAPRFVHLPWTEILSYSRSSPDRCGAKHGAPLTGSFG
jgi:hypothetical protein